MEKEEQRSISLSFVQFFFSLLYVVGGRLVRFAYERSLARPAPPVQQELYDWLQKRLHIAGLLLFLGGGVLLLITVAFLGVDHVHGGTRIALIVMYVTSSVVCTVGLLACLAFGWQIQNIFR
jgi:hypothetical protein